MTTRELKANVRDILAKYTGCKVTMNNITMLESSTFSEMVTYAYFAVGHVTYAYYASLTTEEFIIHPHTDNAMRLTHSVDWE